MRNRKTDPNLDTVINELKRISRENQAQVWRTVAKKLEKPSRTWSEVNIGTLEKHADPKEMVVIAGKLLGTGTLTKAINVSAYSASESAIRKVEQAGGKFHTLLDMAGTNPKGSHVRIMG